MKLQPGIIYVAVILNGDSTMLWTISLSYEYKIKYDLIMASSPPL